MWASRTRAPEKKNVPVGVHEFESTQTIIVVLEWLGKLDVARQEFCCQRVRIGDVEVSVPARPAFLNVSLVVRQGFYTHILDHDHRATPLHNAEKDVVRVGALKRDLEPETVAIKQQRGGGLLCDEKQPRAPKIWVYHISFPPRPEVVRRPQLGC